MFIKEKWIFHSCLPMSAFFMQLCNIQCMHWNNRLECKLSNVFQKLHITQEFVYVHENPTNSVNESNYNSRGLWESCVYYPPISPGISRYSILFPYPAQTSHYWDLSVRVGICKNNIGHVGYFLQYSLHHHHPVTQLENIFWDECLPKKDLERRGKKGEGEEEKEK